MNFFKRLLNFNFAFSLKTWLRVRERGHVTRQRGMGTLGGGTFICRKKGRKSPPPATRAFTQGIPDSFFASKPDFGVRSERLAKIDARDRNAHDQVRTSLPPRRVTRGPGRRTQRAARNGLTEQDVPDGFLQSSPKESFLPAYICVPPRVVLPPSPHRI